MLEFTDDVSKSVDNIRDFVSNFTDELGDAYQALSPNNKKTFFEDFENWTPEQADFFNGTPEGVKAWDAFFPDELIRTNTTWLQKLDDYLTVTPNKLDEVTDMFAIEKGKNRVTAYLRGLLERKHYNGTVYRVIGSPDRSWS